MNNARRAIVRSETEAPAGVASDEQLAEILDGYMEALERDGVPPDIEQLAADHPALADDIRAYGQSLQLLHRAVSRLTPDRAAGKDESSPGVKRLGDFEIVRQVGRGGMGVVYEARQISLNRPVALKILPFAAMLDERQIARFRTEAQAAAGLHHPNIVPVYAIGQERGVHFFAMQFIEGQSLDCAIHELRSGGATWCEEALPEHSDGSGSADRWSKETVVDRSVATKVSTNSRRYCRSVARLAAQAARALHHAHEFGIVHRDVKPSNLLLDRCGKLWVTDFGLARIQTESGVTVSGDVVGTLRYMSPEQAAGSNALVDARTDVYALGATLYELLTLCHVHEADNRQELLRQIESQEPLLPRRINPSIGGDLEAIVLCAMAKSRDDRYETAQAMADDLERYLADEPIRAQRPTALDRAAKWALRHRKAAALAAGLLVVFSLLCAVGAGLIAREKHRTEAALVAAQENLARAEEHFRQARQVVDQFGNRLAGQLVTLPGSEPVRRRLLLETLEYYREFISHAADDPQLRNELATTYSEAGSIAEQLGDRKAAQADFQQALTLFHRLAEQSPDDVSLQTDRAKCLNNLALLLAANGEFETALKRYNEAIGVLQQVPDSPERHAQLVRSLAETYGNLGLMYGQQGKQDAARESLALAIDQLQQLVATDSSRQRDRHDLAICYNNLSYVERDVDSTAASESCGQAIAILSELVDKDPHDLALRSDLALFHNNSGAIQGRTSQWESACASYRQAIALQRQLVRQAPHVVGYRYGLATSLTNLGQALSASGDVPKAMETFGESKGLALELAEDFPTEVQFQSLLGGALNNLAMVEEQSGQLDVALEDYASAVAHQRNAFDLAPQVSDYREFLSKHYFNYGRALRAAGKPAEAAEAALARRRLWPGHGQHLYEIAVELALAAEQLARQGGADDDVALRKRLDGEAKKTLQAAAAAGYDIVQANRRTHDSRSPLPHNWDRLLAEAAAAQAQTPSESPRSGGR
jgi:serine/threonine protein kinase/Flp pilus assembly protein TadD